MFNSENFLLTFCPLTLHLSPPGERVEVRGFGILVIEIYLGFGTRNLVLYYIPPTNLPGLKTPVGSIRSFRRRITR